MSDSRQTTGERGSLHARQASDGGIEYVLGEDVQGERERGGDRHAQKPQPQPEAGAGPGRFVLAAVALFALTSVALAAVMFARGDGEELAGAATAEQEEPVGFKPYGGGPVEEERAPAPPAATRRAVTTRDEDGLPDEFDGIEFGDEEVVVIEEVHPESGGDTEQDEEPAEEVVAIPAHKNYDLNLEELRQRRRPSAEQRKMLRQFNKDLDRGKGIPKLSKPKPPNLFVPAARRDLQVIDNLPGPSE